MRTQGDSSFVLLFRLYGGSHLGDTRGRFGTSEKLAFFDRDFQ
jgi:hypothetical protein